ncbi:PEPxxWA-CTERM sorting domain-containing protein [Sphingomonas azotifigens]|uniref:PEPxxWA-CTERM sorting domain-containing protein n=1 Tax=Sphingomonas azotifigens TaxID=330920 RepID=UPI0009FD5B2A|nr:PEPxxWA-CTERM sorting domain-containing protein [Sphingomonas azotifigens]
MITVRIALASTCLLCALTLPGSDAHAGTTVIYDTGTPTVNAGYFVGLAQQSEIYGAFRATTATITGLEGYFRQTLSSRLLASLYADNNGLPDFANPLASVAFDAPLIPNLPYPPNETPIGGTIHQTVTVGAIYWIGFSFLSGDYDHALMSDTVAHPAIAYAHTELTPTGPGGALQRQGWRQDSLNIGFRILGDAVPEPGSWGLMIVGFGAAGGALRRRRSSVPGSPRLRADRPTAA